MNLGIEYAFAANGADIVTTTAARTGNWMALHVLEAAVINKLTVERMALNGTAIGAADTLNLALGVGAVLYGNFTGLTLTSGKVVLYRRPRT